MKITKNTMIKALINNSICIEDAEEIASLIFGKGIVFADISDYDYQSRLIDSMPVNLRLDYESGLQILNQQTIKALRPSKDATPKKCLNCQMFDYLSGCQANDLQDALQADCFADISGNYVLPIESKNCNKKRYNPFSWIAKLRKCSIKDAISVKYMADIVSSGNNEVFQYCVNNLSFDELVLLSDELHDVDPDVSNVNNLTYGYDEFEYNHLERQDVVTSGQYGHIESKADLYNTVKNSTSVDFLAFKKHESLLTDMQEACQEYQIAKKYIKSGKVQKAKSKARLVAYTYKQQDKPNWLTPDRLAGLWQEVKA